MARFRCACGARAYCERKLLTRPVDERLLREYSAKSGRRVQLDRKRSAPTPEDEQARWFEVGAGGETMDWIDEKRERDPEWDK